MNAVKIKSYAKINLTLEIVGNTGEYHALDSLAASVDIFDLLAVRKRKDKLSSVTMHGQNSENIPPEKNNALKAAERFSEVFGTNGAEISVYKNIPIGAGLGGSSADAAGVLRGMAKLYNVTDEEALAELADELGSDVRYMLHGGFARMRGRGEKLTLLPIQKTLHMLLICPNRGVSSGACYREYDVLSTAFSEGRNTENCIAALLKKDVNGAGRYLTNDLFAPACVLETDVKRAYGEACSFSPLGATMTGSGSCVIALFETKELCEWARSRYRGTFRTIVCKTLIPEKEEKKVWRTPFALSEKEKE